MDAHSIAFVALLCRHEVFAAALRNCNGKEEQEAAAAAAAASEAGPRARRRVSGREADGVTGARAQRGILPTGKPRYVYEVKWAGIDPKNKRPWPNSYEPAAWWGGGGAGWAS